jgi:hypothetical protein
MKVCTADFYTTNAALKIIGITDQLVVKQEAEKKAERIWRYMITRWILL